MRTTGPGLGVIGGAVVAGALLIDAVVAGAAVFDNGPWSPGPIHVLWTIAIGLGLGAVFVDVRRRFPTEEVGGADPVSWWSHRFLLLATVACAAALIALMAVSPRGFNALAREDHVVEYAGALCFLTAAAFAGLAARRSDGAARLVMALAAPVLLWVGLEEVSYFQRVLGFGTPASLSEANEQDEANLHNVATDLFQNGYYLGIALLFVAFPLVRSALPRRWDGVVDRLLPSRLPTTIALVSVVFTYKAAAYPAHHVSFWMAVWFVVLVRTGPTWFRPAMGALLVGGTAAMFAVGPELPRIWAPSEYREMIGAAAVAVWTLEVWLRSRPPVPSGGSAARR